MSSNFYMVIDMFINEGTVKSHPCAYFSTIDKAKKFIEECGYTKELETKDGVGYFHPSHNSKSNSYHNLMIIEKELDKENSEIEIIKNVLRTAGIVETVYTGIQNGDIASAMEAIGSMDDIVNNVEVHTELAKLEKQQKLDSVTGIFDDINSIEDL